MLSSTFQAADAAGVALDPAALITALTGLLALLLSQWATRRNLTSRANKAQTNASSALEESAQAITQVEALSLAVQSLTTSLSSAQTDVQRLGDDVRGLRAREQVHLETIGHQARVIQELQTQYEACNERVTAVEAAQEAAQAAQEAARGAANEGRTNP